MSKNMQTVTGFAPDGIHEEQYMWLNNAILQISPDIQRKIDPMRVADIARNFDAKVANPIKVSFRNEKYYIFDGMHTREALCKLNGKEDFPIFCRVYHGLTKEEEARLFAVQFGFSEDVSMSYRLRAMAVAKDSRILEFLKITKDSGFRIELGTSGKGNGWIVQSVRHIRCIVSWELRIMAGC